MKVSQNYEQLCLVLEETLENGEIPKEDFCRLTVVREAVVKNLLPHELYRLDTKKMKKSIRITFENEGNMVDFGAGRREFFKIATKALFAAGEVFCQEEKCDFFRLKKGAELLLVKEAGFLLGLATLNNIEVALSFSVAFLSKILGQERKFSLEDLKREYYSLGTALQAFRDDPRSVEEDVMGYQVAFTVMIDGTEVPVLPRGENMVVHENNVEEYITLTVNYVMHKHTQEEFKALHEAYKMAANDDFFHHLQPEDLKMAICGKDKSDWVFLEDITTYDGRYWRGAPLIV